MSGEVVKKMMGSLLDRFRGLGLARSNGAESCCKSWIAGSAIPDEGTDYILDVLDLFVRKKGSVVSWDWRLDFGSILDWSCEIWRVLWMLRFWMLILDELVFYVSGDRKVDVAHFVVPIE